MVMKEKIFENTVAENFPKFMKIMISQTPEYQRWVIYRTAWIRENSTPGHNAVKLQSMYYKDLKNRKERQSTNRRMTTKFFNSHKRSQKIKSSKY